MTHRTTARSRGLLAFALALATTAPASAQSYARRTLEATRSTLDRLDPDADETYEAIRTLGRVPPDVARELARRARAERTLAAADLMLLASTRHGSGLRERIAESYGATPETIDARIASDLTALRESARHGAAARDALAALRAERGAAVPTADPAQPRQQATFVHRMTTRLLITDDVLGELAQLGDDPCAEAAPCPPPYAQFGARGRRAIDGMRRVFELAGAIRRAAERGDRFAAAAVREGIVRTTLLQTVRVAPTDWGPALGHVAATGDGQVIEADAVVVVGVDAVRVGWIPEVAFDEAGRPRLTAQREPVLGGPDSTFALPAGLEPTVRPIEGLAQFLRRSLSGASRVALAAEPTAEAHLLSRVGLAAEQARVGLTALVASGSAGVPRGVPLHPASEDELGGATREVGVFVRAGGFSVRGAGPYLSLPRLRESAQEAWRFDYAGLRRALTARTDRPVVVRYMGIAPAETVVHAAVTAAGDGPVRLELR